MGQNFIPDTVDQTLLFPPSLHDWLPEGHVARFVLDVVSALDLSAIYRSYQDKDGRGQAAYAPEMMVRVLLYGYARGVYSSRKIQARTFEDVAFRYLSGDQHPDHATIAEFRKRHLEALSGLFTQALLLCSEAGLVKLGHVSIDGTKIKANASKHKAMSYKHMNETEARLKQEIDGLLAAAEKMDAEEDAQYGKDRQGDELPEELSRRQSRLWNRKPKKRSRSNAPRPSRSWPSAKNKSGAPARRSVAASLNRLMMTRAGQTTQHNATSPIRKAGSCRMGPTRAASCRATMRR
jgi:transposase